jgi:colicin import membrane protein
MTKQARPNSQAKDNKSEVESVKAAGKNTGVSKLVRSPVFKSLLLHGTILASLLISFNFSAKPLKFAAPDMSVSSPQPEIVKATFIDSNVIEQKKREKAQSEAAARKRQQEIKRKEAEQQENIRKKRVEEARKKRELEQKKQDSLKKEQEKERAIEELRIKDAKEKAEQKKRQETLDKELTKQLEEEQAAMSQANQKRILTEVQKYQALVQSKVKQYLQTDGGFIGETCLVNIQLAPDGLVLKVQAVSGKPALCRIAEAAVLRAGTLPVSKDPEVMSRFRKFELEVSLER